MNDKQICWFVAETPLDRIGVKSMAEYFMLFSRVAIK